MTVKTFQQTDYQSQTVEDYEQTIDDNFAVLAGPAGAFAAHEQSTPDMTARVDAGMIAKGDGSVIEAAAQNTGTITAPSSDPRNDIVYLDLDDGTVGVVTGTEAATPADPEFPLGAMPLARINLTTSTTSITNAIVDDCRPGGGQPDRFEQLKHVEKASNADIKRANAGELFVANSVSAITFSLDPAAQLGPDFVVWVKNVGTGQLTVLPDGSETIDGDANLLLDQTEAALICRAGSNFRSLKIGENAGTGTVTSVATGTGLTGGPIIVSGTISVTDGGIDTLQLATDAVGSDEIAAGAVGSSEIATDAVGSDEIAAGAVGASELSAGAITDQTAEATVDGANDEVLLHDNSATALRKVKVDDLVSGGGGGGELPCAYIADLVPSNNGTDSDHDLDITAGVARNAASDADLTLSAITKKFDTAFAAGTNQGALGDSVTLPANGTMHVFLIKKTADGTIDVLGDTSFTGANVPSGWTVQRRIFSFVTDGSNNIRQFVAVEIAGGGLDVLYADPPLDVNTSTLGTTASLFALSVPVDFKVRSLVNAETPAGAASPTEIYVSSPDANDEAPSLSAAPLLTVTALNGQFGTVQTFHIRTDTSAQIRARADAANRTFHVATLGWIDERR